MSFLFYNCSLGGRSRIIPDHLTAQDIRKVKSAVAKLDVFLSGAEYIF